MNNDVKVYEPTKRDLIYMKNICEKIEGLSTKLPDDLKPKNKEELLYLEIYNTVNKK